MLDEAARITADDLRRAVAGPLPLWRKVQLAFSPVDLATGEVRPRVPPPGVAARRAAVLVPVLLGGPEPCLVYTARTASLRHHAGQVSFPGGRVDDRDGSPLAAALREAYEEINLLPEAVEPVGSLEQIYIRPSNFRVSPYVGLVTSDAELVLAPMEVEAILIVPLRQLMALNAVRRVELIRDGRRMAVASFGVAGREIWGATAVITAQLLARLGWTRWEDLPPGGGLAQAL